MAKHDDFAYFYKNTSFPQLNYTICTSNNTKTMHGYMSEKSLWDGLKVSLSTREPKYQRMAEEPGVLIGLCIAYA